MRKIHLLLFVLLSGLGLACQPDPSKARLERVLSTSWQSYCRHFITPNGQVIIPEEGGGTISEAQAYALLRAVWAKDATVFNQVYAWTYEKLSRARDHGDNLLSWRWGKLPDGSWGVLDANSATDGDLDYALALVLAHRLGWRAPPGLPDYPEESRRVQADILAREVVALPGGDLLLTPGNWHEPKPPYLVNPSYFSPAAYRLFERFASGGDQPGNRAEAPPLPREAGVNPARARWGRLHQSTYKLLGQLTQGLEGQTGGGAVSRLVPGGRRRPPLAGAGQRPPLRLGGGAAPLPGGPGRAVV